MDADQLRQPLVDEPIEDLVAELHAADPEIAALVASPRRQLAFRTFAYVRVGVLLGQLLVDTELAPQATRKWVEELLDEPSNYRAVAEQVKAVAREVAADPEFAEDEPDPRPEAIRRFRDSARKSLGE